MKKTFCLALCALLLCALAACGQPPQSESLPAPPPVSSAPPAPPSSSQPKPEPEPEPLEQVEELPITLQFGSREEPYEGVYTGEMLDGLPQGQGSFTTQNAEGYVWTYTGAWNAGHKEGEGTTVWEERGQKHVGFYQNDLYNGPGQFYYKNIVLYDGVFENGYIASGKMYDESGALYFEGDFRDELRLEDEAAKQARLDGYEPEALPYTAAMYEEGLYNYLGALVVFDGVVNEVLFTNETREGLEMHIDMGGGLVVASQVTYHFAYGEAPHAVGQRLRVYGRVHSLAQWEDADPTAFGTQMLAFVVL